MNFATYVVLAFTLVLQGCVFSNPIFGTVDLRDTRTIRVTRGDTVYELIGDIEGYEDFTEIHKLIDKLPKEKYE